MDDIKAEAIMLLSAGIEVSPLEMDMIDSLLGSKPSTTVESLVSYIQAERRYFIFMTEYAEKKLFSKISSERLVSAIAEVKGGRPPKKMAQTLEDESNGIIPRRTTQSSTPDPSSSLSSGA